MSSVSYPAKRMGCQASVPQSPLSPTSQGYIDKEDPHDEYNNYHAIGVKLRQRELEKRAESIEATKRETSKNAVATE